MLNTVIRMVVPMRREFGRSLDVQQFMRDHDYARAVLEQALASQDQRLRDYAHYVSRLLAGAREADPPRVNGAAALDGPSTVPAALTPTPVNVVAPAAPSAQSVTGKPAEPVDATEAELRARMLRKYTTGLR